MVPGSHLSGFGGDPSRGHRIDEGVAAQLFWAAQAANRMMAWPSASEPRGRRRYPRQQQADGRHARPGRNDPLKELPVTLPAVRKHDPASRAAGSSPRRGTGGRGMACFLLADGGSVTAPVVDDHCAGGGQGGHGRPEVVAAQQEIHRMRASRGGRDEDPHHRPGGAAAGAITQSGRPGPVSLVIGRRSGSLVARGPPGGLGPAARKPHPHETSVRQPRAVSVGT